MSDSDYSSSATLSNASNSNVLQEKKDNYIDPSGQQHKSKNTHSENDNASESKPKFEDRFSQAFKTSSTKCGGSKKNPIVSECSSLQRAAYGLKYYHVLCDDTKPESRAIGKEIFAAFCIESYPNFLDDYIHIVTKHGQNLLQIADELRSEFAFEQTCVINKCGKFKRHYNQRRTSVKIKNETETDVSAKENFFCSYFDQLHHFIFHLYDIGMRTNKNEIAEYKHDDNNKNASFDLVFAKKRDLIRSKRKQHGIDIDRYNEENNKYNLIIEQSITNKRTDNGTFLESICLSINTNHGIDDQAAVKLNEFCYNNEYDTDSIECDLNDTIGSGSNLANFLDNKLCIDLIRQCIHITKLSKTSFSTGFSFIYEEKNATHPSYLYVASTYNSIKEEVLFSGLVTASQWDDIILKAQELHTTEKVKYINNKHRSYRRSLLASHLISLTLYCDWSDLCTHFSSTFRKSNVFESIES
eukprot:309799_1